MSTTVAKSKEKRAVSHCQWHVAAGLAWKAVRADDSDAERFKQAETFEEIMRPDDPETGLGVAAGVRARGYG